MSHVGRGSRSVPSGRLRAVRLLVRLSTPFALSTLVTLSVPIPRLSLAGVGPPPAVAREASLSPVRRDAPSDPSQAPSDRSEVPSDPSDGPATYLLIVTGLAGDRWYAASFHELAVELLEAARKAGIPPSGLVYLAEDPSRDPARISGRSTREGVARALEALAERAGPQDQVLVIFLGHGSQREGESVLNLPGPDLPGSELAGLLADLAATRVAVVNAASASGGFVAALSGPNRIVITATASPRERNETLFGWPFVRALTAEGADGADTDKDGRVSLLEAFEYARREVARSYEAENRILTEHALLDDDGDGAGSREPRPGEGDGALAARFFLSSPAAAAAPEDPELAALYAERLRLQERIAAFRVRKAGLDSAAYERGLEDLLLELARTVRAIRAREGGGR